MFGFFRRVFSVPPNLSIGQLALGILRRLILVSVGSTSVSYGELAIQNCLHFLTPETLLQIEQLIQFSPVSRMSVMWQHHIYTDCIYVDYTDRELFSDLSLISHY